jgi:hypothetical protein
MLMDIAQFPLVTLHYDREPERPGAEALVTARELVRQ